MILLSMVVDICNPSTPQGEARGSQVQSQIEQHGEMLQKKKRVGGEWLKREGWRKQSRLREQRPFFKLRMESEITGVDSSKMGHLVIRKVLSQLEGLSASSRVELGDCQW